MCCWGKQAPLLHLSWSLQRLLRVWLGLSPCRRSWLCLLWLMFPLVAQDCLGR